MTNPTSLARPVLLSLALLGAGPAHAIDIGTVGGAAIDIPVIVHDKCVSQESRNKVGDEDVDYQHEGACPGGGGAGAGTDAAPFALRLPAAGSAGGGGGGGGGGGTGTTTLAAAVGTDAPGTGGGHSAPLPVPMLPASLALGVLLSSVAILRRARRP